MPISALLASSLVGAGASVLGNLFGIGGQAKQYSQQKKLIDYQFNKNVDMWNKQNEYNSPSAQVQRLKDAGLNPALVYGDGAVGNTASSAPEYGLADAPNYGVHLQKMLEPMSLQGQAIAQQIQESKSRQQLNGVETVLKSLDTSFSERTLDSRVNTMIEGNKLRLAKYATDIALGKNQIKVGNSQVMLNYSQMQVASANSRFLEANTKVKGLDAEMLSKQLAVFDVNFSSEQSLRRSQISKNYQDISESSIRSELTRIEANYQRLMSPTRSVRESAEADLVKIRAKIAKDPRYIQSVIETPYFKSLSEKEQYRILKTYGMVTADRSAYGFGNSAIGGIANSLLYNYASGLGMFK